MEKTYTESLENYKFNESLLDKMDRVPLLIDYFATVGVRQKELLSYIEKSEEAKIPLNQALEPSVLKKAKIFPEVTGRFPPVDKPSFSFPSDIQSFCFPYDFEIIEGNDGFVKNSSFVLTNETGQKTYITYIFA